MAHTVWLGLRLLHPAEWEPAQLTTDRAHGQCTLVDPYHQRLDVHWRPSRATPDLEKMFRKYRSAAGKAVEEELAGASNWTGFVARKGGQTVTRAGRYFDKEKVLVELAATWPTARDKTLERRVLSGLRPRREGDPLLTQAMGLSVQTPDGFRQSGFSGLAGHVRFDFSGGGGRLLVSRLSLVGGWLNKPLDEWMRHEARRSRCEDARDERVNGHEAYRLMTSQRSLDWRLPLGHREWREDLAWICPTCERLYSLRWVRPGRRRHEIPAVTVGCCEPLSQPEQTG